MDRELLRAELIRDEDLKLKPYRDTAGKLSIGIGRNLDDVGISKEEAIYLYNNDVAQVEKDLDTNLSWWRTLSETRQRVLTNMCFNLGITKLLKFKNTLALIQAGNYSGAAFAMMQSKWADQVGDGWGGKDDRAERLANMMEKGDA